MTPNSVASPVCSIDTPIVVVMERATKPTVLIEGIRSAEEASIVFLCLHFLLD
jgi:hypothetical protein